MSNIFYYWDNPETMPEKYLENINNARTLLPDYEIKLISENDARQAIESFSRELYDLYLNIRVPAAKSDITRLVFLYLYGGWYLDCDIQILKPPSQLEKTGKAIFQRDDKPSRDIWATNQCLYLEANSVIAKSCLDQVLDNYKSKKFNDSVLDFCGPGVLTKICVEQGVALTSYKTYFRDDQTKVFNTTFSKTTSSWKYQQDFGIYFTDFKAKRYDHSRFVQGALNTALNVDPALINTIVEINKGNLSRKLKPEVIEHLNEKNSLLVFAENRQGKVLKNVVQKIEGPMRPEIRSILKNNEISVKGLLDLAGQYEHNISPTSLPVAIRLAYYASLLDDGNTSEKEMQRLIKKERSLAYRMKLFGHRLSGKIKATLKSV